MEKYYIENRIWYVGYTWINLNIVNLNLININSDFSSIKMKAFCFNNYATNDILHVVYSADKLENYFQNSYYDVSKTQLEFKFLNNGCLNIILTMQPKNSETFSQKVKKLDQDGAESFEKYNEDILSFLFPLLQSLINNKIMECNELSLWGIPNLLSKNPLDLTNIDTYGRDAKNMQGTKTLHWSVLYNQNIISNDEEDYKLFVGTEGQIYNEIILRSINTAQNENNSIAVTVAWGKKYWRISPGEFKDVQYFLEVDAINLSKIVILATSIYFNTELSLILLKDSILCGKASVDQLRKPNALLRTHLSCTEMFTQDFSEDAKLFYEKIDKVDYETMKERVRLQKESEETLLQIANSAELSSNETKAEWFQFLLATISVLTIFSVLQDVFAFVLIDDKIPNVESFRLLIISVVSLFLLFVIYHNMPSKNDIINKILKKIGFRKKKIL